MPPMLLDHGLPPDAGEDRGFFFGGQGHWRRRSLSAGPVTQFGARSYLFSSTPAGDLVRGLPRRIRPIASPSPRLWLAGPAGEAVRELEWSPGTGSFAGRAGWGL